MMNPRILTTALIVFISALLFITPHPASSKKEDKAQTTTVTGMLIRVMVIGGETTGWAVNLDTPLQIAGKAVERLEIDPAGQEVDNFENRRVEVKGILEKRYGIERGEYWVLVVKEMQELKTKK